MALADGRSGRILGAEALCVAAGDELRHQIEELVGIGAAQLCRHRFRTLRQYELAHGRRRGDGVCPGISIGVAHVDLSRPMNSAQLVEHADQALYAAKAAGKRIVMVRDVDGCCPPSLVGERPIPDYVF